MALRRSSRSILKLGSVRRRSRGSGGSFDMTSAPRLYDMEYRQMTEDYRDEIISFDEYIAFLKEKEMGLKEGGHDRFTISKRIKDITTAYNKKAESEFKAEVKLEEQKYAEDYRNGLIGYEAFYPYLQEKADHFCGLDPNSSECFMATKKANDVEFQQADRELDFKFKVLKTVEPDDYISWKENQLEGLDPNSNSYMQLQTDIKSAKEEKRSREKNVLEFDILLGEKNKQDLIGWYNDQAKNATDPETQMKYITLSSKTQESMDKELETAWRKERALEDKEAALKFRRGDFGDTDTENREGYYSFLNERYNTEHDPSRQMTYMGKMDTLVKQEEEAAESKYKKAVAVSKKVRAENEKLTEEDFKKKKGHYYSESARLDKELEAGNLTTKQWAQERYRMLYGEDGYLKDLYGFEGNSFLTDSIIGDINSEFERVDKDVDENSFFRAVLPKDRDSDGKWDEDEKIIINPNYKFVMNFSKEGSKAGTFSAKAVYSDGGNPYHSGHIQDPQTGLWYKTEKNKDGNLITHMPDGEGGISTITEDPKTGQWGIEFKEEGRESRFEPSKVQPMEIDMSKANYEQRLEYFQNEQKDQDRKSMSRVSIGKESLGHLGGDIGKIGEAIGDPIRKTVEGMMAKGPMDMASDIINEAKEKVTRSAGQLPEDFKTVLDAVNMGMEKKIGDVGEDVKLIQRNLNLKNITGYWGPKTQEAYDQAKIKTKPIQDKITADFSADSFGRLGSDLRDIGKFAAGGITSAAQKMYGQTAQARNKIGGALGDVYAKRKDLQQHFDASGKGISAAWKGHTIQEWAERHGKHEEVSLKGGTFKAPTIQPPPQLKQFDFGKAREEISSRVSPLIDFGKDLFSPIQQAAQKARSRITSDFSKEKRKRLGSDVKTIKKYATQKAGGWLSKLKWWK